MIIFFRSDGYGGYCRLYKWINVIFLERTGDFFMKKAQFIPAALVALLAALVLGSVSLAETGPGKGTGEGYRHMMYGKGEGFRHPMYGGGEGYRHMMQGRGGCDQGDGYRHHWGKKQPKWKQSLSDEQKTKLRAMKVEFSKQEYPLGAKMKLAKIELAVLVANDAPDQNAISAKIDELTALKKQMLKAKYDHKIAVRAELTPEQRVMFDQHMLKKAKQGKKRGGCHRR